MDKRNHNNLFRTFTGTDGSTIKLDMQIVHMVKDERGHRVIYTPFEEIEVIDTMELIVKGAEDVKSMIRNYAFN